MPRPTRTPTPAVKAILDFAPLLVFFIANRVAGHYNKDNAIFIATGAVMASTLVVMAIAHFRYGRIQPMLWLVGTMVFVFGGATLLFHDSEFIKIKLTVIYALLAAVLLFGVVTGRPLLKLMLGETITVDDAGWRTLTWSWIGFFVALAALNEVLRRVLTQNDDWVTFKVFGVPALTFVFALVQAALMLRHTRDKS